MNSEIRPQETGVATRTDPQGERHRAACKSKESQCGGVVESDPGGGPKPWIKNYSPPREFRQRDRSCFCDADPNTSERNVVIGTDAFFTGRSQHLASLALKHSIPAIYQFRLFTESGGLVSYGGSFTEVSRLAGLYVARILKGEKPAELPVVQSTKVELIINLKTAKALGITVPLPLLGRADEVIE